jgi:hypothetical protein
LAKKLSGPKEDFRWDIELLNNKLLRIDNLNLYLSIDSLLKLGIWIPQGTPPSGREFFSLVDSHHCEEASIANLFSLNDIQ